MNIQNSVKKNLVAERAPIDTIIKPFQQFAKIEASGGIILLIFTVVALVWANSGFSGSYTALWELPVTIGAGSFILTKSLSFWINDLLMAVFFFVVGLEIKREMIIGELASFKQAALPIAAALGGMIVPALLYTMLNSGTQGIKGWGIPMATDIAFAIGILTLLGDRVPVSLKIFLTALAIVDDLGAVLVIAIFYTADFSLMFLLTGLGFLAVLFICNRLLIRHTIVYIILGLGLWLCFLKSGVHPTIAGVLLAFTIPARMRMNKPFFITKLKAFLAKLEIYKDNNEDENMDSTIEEIEIACEKVQSPMQRLDRALHSWVAYFIMPVFALANAGVIIEGDFFASLTSSVSLGVILGLVLGKQIGVFLFSYLAVKFNIAILPQNVSWKEIYAVGCLAGIGFTMSLFVAGLAFPDNRTLALSKIGILMASFISSVLGLAILYILSRNIKNKKVESGNA